MLELNLGPMTICPTLLYDEQGWTLVDTGMPGSTPSILELAKLEGIGDIPLRSIVLTHQDIDHIGGLPGFVNAAAGEAPTVYAHEDDRRAINGTQPLIKVSSERLSGILQALPETVRTQFERTFLTPARPNVDRVVADGDVLPIAGGVTVIHTPGHTPGHVSLYHSSSKTLIAGDSMVIANGELKGPNPPVTPNMEQALRSLVKYKAFDIENVICYHGGCLQDHVNKRIAELVERS